MVTARSAAMGFNRLVDARFDALNPRTANRARFPRGVLTVGKPVRSSSLSSLVFVYAAWRLNPLCLAPLARRARR